MKVRLQKIVANAGIASRRKAEQLIAAGRVTVNRITVTQPGTLADPSADTIAIDGIELEPSQNKVYIMLNKPAGCITSVHDPQGRATVIDMVPEVEERVVPVGRLDFDTEGLLILTNDGQFSQILQHPKFRLPRTYRVKVKDVPAREAVRRLQNGILLNGRKTSRCSIKFIEGTEKNSWYTVVLHEGRNRQIKLMFESIGHRVLRIIRTGFGPLVLGRLPSGTYRFLKKNEIEAIRDAAEPGEASGPTGKTGATARRKRPADGSRH